ncbi:MAG: hypothetical protein H6R10_657 [Rhodocyclaceae bacterium]|nr:hypothetical protein [Rhodocyclaceae bacterium]
MISDETVIKRAQAAIEVEPRVNIHSFPLHMELKESRLVLDGDVETVAAKRLAVRLAREVTGIQEVIDQVHVIPAKQRGDGEILESFTQLLQGQVDLRNCTMSRSSRGRIESLHQVPDDRSPEITFYKSGEIVFSVDDGTIALDGYVISLSHKRILEVLAWWVPGCCNVINRLAVEPAEPDNDDEVSDAVRLVLEMDPLLSHADQINISTSQGIVALQGILGSEEERNMAEFDAWCVPGVTDVENRLEVGK